MLSDLEQLAKYKAVVVSDLSVADQLRINAYTHEKKIAFVSTSVFGLFGNIFCDFGEEFAVVDPTGENPVSGILAGIDDTGMVTTFDESRHGLEDGDYVTFREVEHREGCEGLDINVDPETGLGPEFKVEVKGKDADTNTRLHIADRSFRTIHLYYR